MAKRKTHDSDEYYDGLADDPIGLTSAFKIVHDPQSVQYDKGDDAIGLTEAFAKVDMPESRSWSEETKWDGFDWDSGWDEGMEIAHTGSTGRMDAVSQNPVGQDDAYQSADGSSNGQQTGSLQTIPSLNEETRQINVEKDLAHASIASAPSRALLKGKHAAKAPATSDRMRKSRRTRNILIFIVVLLVAALGVLGYFGYRTITAGQEEAAHQAQEKIEEPKETATQAEGDDTVETAAKLTDVPKLTPLFGKTTDEAVAALERGAFVVSNQKVKEKGSAVKTNVTIALNDEPADTKTGAPSVYLGLDKKGKIIQVGYSASASALGFGSLSFADAVNSEHVIEKTLEKIGVKVKDGSAVLPKDRSKYAKYASDKTTVERERCSFEGDVDVDGVPCTWSAVLSYDYKTQIITGNLSDTVRVIYAYVTQK